MDNQGQYSYEDKQRIAHKVYRTAAILSEIPRKGNPDVLFVNFQSGELESKSSSNELLARNDNSQNKLRIIRGF